MRTAGTVIVAGVLAALGLSLSCGARTSLPGVRGDDIDGRGGDGPGGEVITVGPIATSTTTGDGGGGNDGGGGQDATGGGPPVEQCDPDVLFVYLVTSETDLYRFDPRALDTGGEPFELVGALSCPTVGGSPFSMAVSRSGRAYSVFDTGELFRINVKNAACSATDWQPGTAGFDVFGMGYALDDEGGGEQLYVADINLGGVVSDGLGRIDTDTFDLEYIGPFSQNPGSRMEMTSADDGGLYAFFIESDVAGGTLVEIDKNTAEIVQAVQIDEPSGGNTSLAFAYWGGNFYIFVGAAGSSTVTRYRPDVGIAENVATLPRTIVGAGVSTCDPDEAR